MDLKTLVWIESSMCLYSIAFFLNPDLNMSKDKNIDVDHSPNSL